MNADIPANSLSSSISDNPDIRATISALFIGFSRERAAQVQAALQANGMASRCRHISNEDEFTHSLSERGWDIVLLCNTHLQALSFARAAEIIQSLDKDIPLLLLCDTLPEATEQLALIESGITLACTGGHEKLKVIYIYQAYTALQQRQQWRHTEALLEKAERRIQALIDDSRTAICFIRDNKVTYGNNGFFELLGYDQQAENFNHFSFDQLVAPSQREMLLLRFGQISSGAVTSSSLPVELIRADGIRIQTTLTLHSTVHAQNEVVQIDITQDQLANALASEQDVVSGLLNKDGFTQHLEHALEQARQGGNDAFLFYLSLDNPQIEQAEPEDNDHLAETIAQFLTTQVSESQALSRLDNSVYACILSNLAIESVKEFADRLCHGIAGIGIHTAQGRLNTTCSIGIAMISESAPRVTALLNRAETAARSLSQGNTAEHQGNGYAFYQLDANQALLSTDAQAVQRVVDAITHNRFRLLFQPIVLLDTEVHLGNYEVLLRLLNTDDQEESPSLFMSNLNDDNVLARMDMWVLEECTRLMRASLDQNQRNRLFINLTGKTLRNKSLLPWFAEQLRSLRLPADHFVFEISEVDALASPSYYKAFCSALHKLQCKICLNHYGSTSESSYVLAEAKVDFIKLDGSYLHDLKRNITNLKEIERLIIPLKEQKLTVIAPMVEDTRQMSTLFRLGVQMVQGHYLQPPRSEMDYAFFDQ